jgi:predicted O-linked N-acetylglucosamine transferase (SPINDLY family)
MARLALADLGLDTFIYGGHTTAADLLRAGVPMVTRLGPDFATRVGASLLTSLGMPALIAPGIAACAELATALAADTGRLAACRSELQARGPAAALFDTPRLVRGMERAYDAMVTNWRAGMSPAQIDLSEPPYSA